MVQSIPPESGQNPQVLHSFIEQQLQTGRKREKLLAISLINSFDLKSTFGRLESCRGFRAPGVKGAW